MRPRVQTLIALLAAGLADASQTQRFVLDTPQAMKGALARGVAINADGSLTPLPPFASVASFEEPLGLALALAEDQTAFVGTGHPARVWRVRDGEKSLLAEIDADQVTALLVAPTGDLYIATAVPAALYRVPRRTVKAEMVSRLAQGNLWDLAWYGDALVAAAGNPARLLRLGSAGLELLREVPDRHARCLAVAGQALLIGTSGKGLVLRWSGEGPLSTLYDSSFTEIAALAVAPDGTAYAAALTGDPTIGKPPKEDGEASVTVETETPPAAAAGATATSEILRITPEGAATTAHRFTKQLACALAWGERGLVIGTGIEGEVWQLADGEPAGLDTVDAAQVTRLARGGDMALTQGPVRLLRRFGAPAGIFTSPPLDAGQPARWGEARVDGELPAGARCSVRFRAGGSQQPDETWSEWGKPSGCGHPVNDAPPARYLQVQVELDSAGKSPMRVSRIEISYRQLNLAPTISELTLHPPGEVFLKGPPPSDRIVEVSHPDLNGIFTTLDDDEKAGQDRLGKKYYRVGYQSVSWKAEDANKDPLRFRVEVFKEGGRRWWSVRDRLESSMLSFDTQALADGRYRLRLTASDDPANPDEPRTAQKLSSWFMVDNTPPRVLLTREGKVWRVSAEDALSPLAIVEWCRDASGWQRLTPADGLLDGSRETFFIPAQPGAHTLAVRAVDDHHNRTTVAVEEEP